MVPRIPAPLPQAGAHNGVNSTIHNGSPPPMRTSEKPAVNTAGLSGPASRKLPVPPRERKPALAALAVLLILGGALATTLLVLRSGDRISVIRVTQQIGAGQKFPEKALEEVQVANTGLGFVSWSQR